MKAGLRLLLLVGSVALATGQDGGYGEDTVVDDGEPAAGYDGGAVYQPAAGYDGGPAQEDTSYESEEVPYQAPVYTPNKVIEVINRPSTCSCNRDSPCFDRKANRCVKAICDGRPEILRHKGMSAPEIRLIEDKKDPNAIVLGISMLGLDVVDDDPEDVAGSANDDASKAYSDLGYGDAQYEKETCFPCRCPAYTHRCEDFNQFGKWSSVCIFLEFFFLLIFACLFLYQTFIKSESATRMWIAVATIVVTVGSLTAFIIMTGGGMEVRCWDHRHYYWIRYVGYMIIAPQCMWIVTAVGRGGGSETREHPFSIEHPLNYDFYINGNLVLLAVTSVLMFASWMAGSFLESKDKWVYWFFGVVCLITIFLVLRYGAPSLHNRLPYRMLSNLCIFPWAAIAILWLFDEGLGWVSLGTQVILLFILDMIWIGFFGLIAVYLPWGQTKQ